jgi:hypothetical protein
VTTVKNDTTIFNYYFAFTRVSSFTLIFHLDQLVNDVWLAGTVDFIVDNVALYTVRLNKTIEEMLCIRTRTTSANIFLVTLYKLHAAIIGLINFL